MGPIELLVVEFRGNHFKGEIIPALRDIVDKGLIRIIDLVFVKKDRHGAVTVLELNDMEDEIAVLFDPITNDINGMMSQDDIAKIAGGIHKNCSVGLLAIEYVWATELHKAIHNAKGRLVFDTLVSPETAEKALISAGAGQS